MPSGVTNCEAGANWATALKRLELLDRSAEPAQQSSGSGGIEGTGSGGILRKRRNSGRGAMSVAIPSMEEPLLRLEEPLP